MATFDGLKKQAEDIFNAWLGKTVYFISDNRIVCGQITSYDDCQIFVGSTHCLSRDKKFFLAEKELLEYLVATKLDATKKE